METTTATFSAPLERSVSQQSATSIRSHRSTARTRKKLTSQPSSSASSIAPSDKSLTSFPSFSPDSPREEGTSYFRGGNDMTPVVSPRKASGLSLAASDQGEGEGQGPEEGQGQEQNKQNNQQDQLQPSTTVDHLTNTAVSPARGALFEDAPLASRKIPGALHLADDEHIERLITRHGAVNLVRQIAEDLAQRDERERALRKIVLECGLSSLDMETRLRAMEQEAKANGISRRGSGEGLSDLMTDAMTQDLRHTFSSHVFDDATIRPSSVPLPTGAGNDTGRGSTRGWKDYLWGGSGKTVKKPGRTNSTVREASKQPSAVVKATPTERRPALQEDLFNPPEEGSVRSSSRASSVNSSNASRKPSLASMALRLVAGGAAAGRDGDTRGRTTNAQDKDLLRTQSSSNLSMSGSTRAVSAQGGPKALMAMRRPAGPVRPIDVPSRTQLPERWDTMVSTPGGDPVAPHQNYGPVEMDTILPPEAQPPTLTHIYNNHVGADFLTDRFGFIYDQRRKKREREAAQMAGHAKKNSRAEMIHGRHGLSPVLLEDNSSGKVSVGSDGRPGTPCSSEEPREDTKPKRWQDYLKIATFPTELLSHTPLISAQGFEVLEAAEGPKSPGHSPSMMSEDRGFLPSATTTAAITPSDPEIEPRPEGEQPPAATLAKEDAEPVRMLLENLNNLHDTLQREKTVRWNDFLRKVRAERKRDGEAAAAAAAAAAEARFQRATAVMPETRLGDGELIGVASLGIQGKVGRAKANEFRSLVLGGVPVASRSKIWSECCGANALRIPGYYASLMARPESSDDAQVVAQIKADITRTLTDNIFFRKGPGVQKLHDVLLAYSRRNPDVGYCQGMNLVVANLLLITPSAEDAFWILCSMVETILPPHYFDHSLLASRADQVVLRQYVAELLPKLSAHFDDLSIDLETMTFQWFLSLFTDCLSAEALFRVWDVVLCSPLDAAAFLFQVALALLKLNEAHLLRCESPAEVYTYINHEMTNHAISIDGLVQASEALRRLVRRDEVEVRRKRAVEGEMGGGGGVEVEGRGVDEAVINNSGEGGSSVGVGQKAGVVPAVVSQEVVMGGLSRSASRAPSPTGERENVGGGAGLLTPGGAS
ncbi:rab-GTPase-TBC domain-containing protein [Chaetomium tenue]|uniref:Rab-GTPase-TBC domain-containing protein n=1 Tax=Chaetomium tenue TaxID=1854479 RepID=A0ACB7NU97_9PEZI|nr:rab-GTPase-TBC domain-containing protein [Chaetomium globosum]